MTSSEVLERLERLEKTVEALIAEREEAEDVRAFDSYKATPDPVLIPSGVVDAIMEGKHPIAAWREHRGLTQEDLAADAQTSRTYISQIEARHEGRSAGRKLRVRLGEVLGCHPDALLDD